MVLPVVPVWNHDLLLPVGMKASLFGASVSGGRSLTGQFATQDISGGGLWQCTFDLDLFYPAQHRFYMRMALRLTGGVRCVLVPLITDWTGPFDSDSQGVPTLYYGGIPHSDNSLFSDEAGYSQGSVTTTLTSAADAGDGSVQMRVKGGTVLEGGEVFEIRHPTKNSRWYGIWNVDDIDNQGSLGVVYTVSIRPTLREDVADNSKVFFSRPKCLMRLPANAQMPWVVEDFMRTQVSVTLVEASSLMGGP